MTKPRGFPDFFVVGAPRSGTTSLCRYLARNPQICFSRPKEPHYFTRTGQLPSAEQLQKNYLDYYFYHHTAAHRSVGEGSVSYLYLPGAIEQILQINPDVRFIAMVRNPLKMLPSYHLRMRFLLQEDVEDFETAWRLQAERARAESLPACCLDARVLMYGEIASFGAQVGRLFDLVGRDRAHIIVFDDFLADPLGVYRQALDFLEVEYDRQVHFDDSCESQFYRYSWLQQMFFIPVRRGGKLVETLQRSTRKYNADGTKRKTLINRIVNWNAVSAVPTPLTPRMAGIVRDHLGPDVQLLSRLLQRDLSHWLSG